MFAAFRGQMDGTFASHNIDLLPASRCDSFVSKVLSDEGYNHIAVTILENKAIEGLDLLPRRSFVLGRGRISRATLRPV